jgi:hypothetical protein
MPSKRFNDSIARLNPSDARSISNQLDVWKNEPPPSDWAQIAHNIENETALPPTKLAKLLGAFAVAMRTSSATDAWVAACRANQFMGRELKSSETPDVLGRLMKLEQMVNLVLPHGVFPASILETLIAEADGVDPATVDPTLPDLLRAAPLGRYLIWATFDVASPDQDPFLAFSASASDCCTILGLLDPVGATCILLHYQSGSDVPPSGFHRPTIADATDFPLYRPRSSSSAIHGMTNPTEPNPNGFSGRPELVHGEITGNGLIFPYRLAV